MAIGTSAMLAGAALAPVVGGAIGAATSAGARGKAQQAQEQALAQIMGVSLPQLEQMKVALQQYQSAGELSPEMLGTVNASDSEFKNISVDPRYKDAQLAALQQLQDLSNGGMRIEDQAAVNKIRGQVERDEKGRQESILQNMQARGVGGGGAELAARLNSSQGAANRASDADMDVASNASLRALQAMANAGTLGGQMQGQEFGQQAQQASAQDVINRYNSMNQQQVMGTNTGARNSAQASNLQNAQNIKNMNTGLANQEETFNKGLYQQDFNNRLNLAQVKANAQSGQASNLNNQANSTAQMWSGIGTGVGQAAAGVAGHQQQAASAAQQQDNIDKFLSLAQNKKP